MLSHNYTTQHSDILYAYKVVSGYYLYVMLTNINARANPIVEINIIF